MPAPAGASSGTHAESVTRSNTSRRAADQRYGARRRAIRAEIIDLLGGECCACGRYEGAYDALHIHHMGRKTYRFSTEALSYKKITADFFAELRECVVLCMQCHQTLHANFTRNDPTP